ncbi:beta-lactamase-like protein [Lactarius deliciosus]|nr:beta-lactamase-like protein [Lactarius deliciosus]
MSEVTSPLPLPAFKGSTVRVFVMDAGHLVAPSAIFVQSPRPGHDTVDVPTYSFLVENERVGKKVLFELGIMKAWKEKLPQLVSMVQSVGGTINITEDVPDKLNAASISLSSIDFVIWSHHHPDHTGDLTLFPTSTSLVVGPGFKSHPLTYPGQPLGPNAETLHEAFEGREVIELDFGSSASTLNIAGLRAIDWFDDGSFYLLEAPGHTADHIMALARTSADKFVLLAGDGAHHCGEIRPTPLTPLPDTISPSPFEPPTSASSCPCSLFQSIHPSPESFRTTPFYEVAAHHIDDPVARRATLNAIKAFDASPDVLVVLTHDASLIDVLDFFPKADLAGWEKQPSRKDMGRWRFLNDFRKDVLKE